MNFPGSQNKKNVEKKTPTTAKIVANLSPVGKDVACTRISGALARKANPS